MICVCRGRGGRGWEEFVEVMVASLLAGARVSAGWAAASVIRDGGVVRGAPRLPALVAGLFALGPGGFGLA